MNEKYTTSDMALTAYLACRGFAIDGIKDDPDSPTRKLFIIARKRGLRIEDAVGEFHERRGMVEPNAYFNEIKALKNRLYQ